MRHPLKDFPHRLKLMLAELRHTAERTIAPNQSLVGSAQQFSQLEQRLMMSASPAAAVISPDAADVSSTDVSVDRILDQVFQSVTDDSQQPIAGADRDQSDLQSSTPVAERELVIIDASILDPEEWIAGLRQDLPTSFDVLILAEDQDGFARIADALDGRVQYSAIHIVSHGTDAQLSLGQSTLDFAGLQSNEGVLESWRAGLAEDADVLIYGCELAESEEGQQLIESLAALWEADVAASDDLTGHDSLNGDWDLEFHSGLIQAPIAFSAAFTETWVGVLSTNAAPVNVVPDGQTVLQDRILSFSDANGNAISLSDSDVGANDLQLTVEASAGSFTITDAGTAEYTTGDGFDDATLVLQGTEAELNAALQNLQFTASAGFVGVVDITVTTDDLGNGGTVTSTQDSDVISVYVHRELVTGGLVVANSATDEMNRNANRGVARSLAVAANGDLISVWRTATDDVFFAIHASDNSVIATGQVNDTGIAAGDIAVATGGDGDFVVAWSQEGATDADVYAQRYSATGSVEGSRIVVDTAVGIQQAVTIDRNAAGDFVIAWENTSDGIHVKRFAADGSAIDVAALSPTGGAGGSNASVGIDRDLNLLLGWDDSSGQYVQHFDGSAWGTKHTLSTRTFASGSSIGMTENGEAVIAWHENVGNWRIGYQRIGSDGTLIGSSQTAAAIPAGDELNPSVGMDEAGNFVIAWETNGDIQARQFDAVGDPISGDLTLVADANFKNNAAIAVLDVNNFAVLNTRQSTSADLYLNRFQSPAVSTSDPVIDLRDTVVGTANTTISHTVLIGDDDTESGSLGFGVTSSMPSLISQANVSITGTGLYRTLQIIPTADMTGSADITITVTDSSGNETVQTLEVFVASPTITVTNTSDVINGNVSSVIDLLANPGGDGISLREAITAANNTANSGRRDLIEFDILGASQQTISLTSELPTITDRVFIDGQSQQGYGSTPLIGLDGSVAVGNGLTIAADGVAIRGLSIFGFQQFGIDLDTGNGILIQDSDNAVIYDNYIGVDQTGQTDIGNDRDGIRIVGQSDNNIIGGVGIQRRNVISGNSANGIAILGDSGNPSTGNEISYNYVGVGADGASDVGNSFVGVDIRNAFQTEILNNVISGNGDSGIELSGGDTGENKILGNFIGVAADGVTSLGNDADGIALYTVVGEGPGGTQIGGVNSGEGNIIAHNSLIGVRLDSGGGVGNSIRGNQIFNNAAGLGIDLLGVNGNDSQDTDSGTNGQQNFPLLTVATLDDGDLTIQGTLNSNPNTVFDIDIYSSVSQDFTGAGEAETFLGTFSVTTNGSGDSTFSHVFPSAASAVGRFITATATNSTGSTSEFGPNQVVVAPLPANAAPTVSLSNVVTSVDENSDTNGGLKIADIIVTDDGQGTNTLSVAGADAADFEIVGTELRLRSGVVLDYEAKISFAVEVHVDDASLPGSPEDSAATLLSVNNLNDTVPQNSLWFSNVFSGSSESNVTGIDSWNDDDAIVLGDPSLNLGSGTSSGHLSQGFSLDEFVQDGSAAISGLHVVGRDITVGNSTTFDLKAGDVLFSTSAAENYNGGALETSQHDVVVFRPTALNDYTSGTFSLLLDAIGGTGGFEFLSAFTLVEQDTTIGDTVVQAGDFLFTSTKNAGGNDVHVFDVDTVGVGNTSGAETLLLNGPDLGIGGGLIPAFITGLELIETTTVLGGQTFTSGTILIASSDSPSDLSTNDNDIFALDVSSTEIGSSTTAATSSLVLRGDDIGTTWISGISVGPQVAEVTSLSAVADSYLSNSSEDDNYGGNSSLVVDKSGGSLGNERAVLRFDLSSLPAGAVITSAQLVLQATAISDPFDIDVYEVTEAWDENSVTYDERTSGVDWDDAGGTIDGTVLDTFEATTTGNHVWDITSLAAAWQDGSKANHGVLLGSTDTGSEDVIYDSREGTVAPQLVLTFTTATVATNDPPVANVGGPYVIDEGDGLSLDASGSSDPESDGLTYAWDLDNDGNFDDAAGVSPTLDWASLPSALQDDGVFTVRVSVSDGTNPAQVASTTLTINNVAPTGNSDSGVGFVTSADAAFTTASALANDTDPAGANDPLLIDSIDTTGTQGQVSFVTGDSVFQYDPNGQFDDLAAGESATDTFLYVASDGDGGRSADTLVTVTIQGVNDAPTDLQLDNLTLQENADGAVVGELTTTDVDTSDSHSYTVNDGRFEIVGSSLRLKSGQSVDFEVETSITLNVTTEDTNGLQLTRSFTIAVTDENDTSPVVAGGQVFGILDSVSTGTSVGTVAASDVDTVGTLSGFAIDSGNTAGAFSINSSTGEVLVADAGLLNGVATPFYDLEISVSDGVRRSASTVIRINVADNNTAPVAVDDTFSLSEGGTFGSAVQSDWFNSSWKNRQQITIDNSAISSSLDDYPLRLRFHATALDAINIDYANLQADGSDLVFVDPDGTVLAYEVERWDPNGYSDVWVRVPTIDGGTTDSITVYYTSNAINPSPPSTQVWASTDVAILHFDGDSINSSGLTADGVALNVTAAPGLTGQALSFDGADSEVRFAAEAALDDVFIGGGTVSAWINPASWGENGSGRIVDKAATYFGPNGAGWTLQVDDSSGDGRLVFETGFSGNLGRWSASDGNIDLNQWHHVAVVYDSSNSANDPKLYLNGIEQTVNRSQTPSGTVLSDAALDLTVGNFGAQPTRTFDGLIDEVRVRRDLASGEEIFAEFRDVAAPVVSASTVVSGPGGVLNNDSDSDADALTVSLVSGPSNSAAFQLHPDGSFSYTHDGSETTSDSFVYEISDGLITDTATVSFSIAAENDQIPEITAGQNFSLSEAASAGTVVGLVAATDGDTGTSYSNWTITSGNAAGHFQIDSTTGAISLSPSSSIDFEAQSTFSLSLTVSDGVNTSAVETVSIQLLDQNDNAPVVTSGLQFNVSETAAPGTVVGTATATDVDSVGSLANWTITSGNAAGHFQIDPTTGTISLSPSSSIDFESQSTFNLDLTVSDGVNTSAVQNVVVQVVDQNDNLPVVTAAQSFDISETAPAGASVGVVTGTDVDVDDVVSNWTIVSGNNDGQFVLNSVTGELRLANNHTLNFDSTDTYVLGVTASDGANTSAVETVTVRITDVDRLPTISAILDKTVSEDAAATSVSFSVFDPDTVAADLIVTAVSSNSNLIQTSALALSGTGANRQLSFTPVPDASGGFATITVTVSDGINSVDETFDVFVTAVNDAPVVNPIADQTVDEDGTLTIGFSATDVDSASTSLTVSALSSDPTLVSANGIQFAGNAVAPFLNVTPESDQFGSVQITVTVSDGMDSSSTTFLLTVSPVNDAPTLTNLSVDLTVRERSLSISESRLLTGAADIDSPDLQLVLNAGPLNGSLVQVSPGEYAYLPNAGFSGQDQFEYSVSDGALTSDLRVVNLDVPAAVPSPSVTNPASRSVTSHSVYETKESSSEKTTESELTSETVEDEPASLVPNGPAGEGSKATTAVGQAEDIRNDEFAETAIGKIINSSGDGFVFRKLITVNEAGDRVVGAVILRDEYSRSQPGNGRRSFDAGSETSAESFDQSDWQYYSDLKSTVGGVQVFRDNLQNEFAFSDLTTGTITLASTGAAVGFVVTAVRSGMLALGFLSQLPVWTLFDPLMVVDGVTGEDTDEDSIHDIVDRQSALDKQGESPSSPS